MSINTQLELMISNKEKLSKLLPEYKYKIAPIIDQLVSMLKDVYPKSHIIEGAKEKK